MYRKPSVNLVEVVHFDEDDRAFREANHKELVQVLSIWVLDEVVIRMRRFTVFVKIRKYLTIILWWLRITFIYRTYTLTHALPLIIFQTFGFLQPLKRTSLTELLCVLLFALFLNGGHAMI